MTLLGDLVKPQNGAGAWSTVKRVCREQVTPDHVNPERPKLGMTGLGNWQVASRSLSQLCLLLVHGVANPLHIPSEMNGSAVKSAHGTRTHSTR